MAQDRVARQAWFNAVILPHESALRSRIRRLTLNQLVDVDDVVSEALIKAYQAKDFSRIVHGRAYLFTVARHLLMDLARRRSVVSFDLVASLETFDIIDPAGSPESIAMARDELSRLQGVVDRLPAHCRQVLLLRRIDGLPMAEIADRMGLSVSTVEKHLSKAIALLTRGLAEVDPTSTEQPESPAGPSWRNAKDGR